MIVRRSSALRHFRVHDRLVVIVIIAINKNPCVPLLFSLLRVCRFRLRRLLPLVGLDRVAESADRMRQFGFRRCLRNHLHRISATFADIRDNAVVARGQRLRGRVADVLKEGLFGAFRRVRGQCNLIGGREWDRRSIDLLDFSFRTTDYLAR